MIANAGIFRLFAFTTDVRIKFEPEILRLGIGVLFELDDEIIVFAFGQFRLADERITFLFKLNLRFFRLGRRLGR